MFFCLYLKGADAPPQVKSSALTTTGGLVAGGASDDTAASAGNLLSASTEIDLDTISGKNLVYIILTVKKTKSFVDVNYFITSP